MTKRKPPKDVLMSPSAKRIRNWKDYNKSLVKRGQLLLSFSTNYINELYHQSCQQRGGCQVYSSQMYEFLFNIKVLLRLPWRATTGFAYGLLQKAFPDKRIQIPDYAHASREIRKLQLKIKPLGLKAWDNLELAFDSTGVNVYSTSGYHQRKYGKDNLKRKKDQWKKVHVAVELNTMQVVSMAYTESTVNDCEVANELFNGVGRPIESLRADGAYDTFEIYERGHQQGAKILIPPAITSKAQDELKNQSAIKKEYLEQRDATIHFIRQFETFEEGLKQWKIESGYHQRSLVETTMFRLKRIFGFNLQLKTEEGRRNELIAKMNLLNHMAALGLPMY